MRYDFRYYTKPQSTGSDILKGDHDTNIEGQNLYKKKKNIKENNEK